MRRVRLPYKGMDFGARVWMRRLAAKQFWRVASWYELEDLIQDGHIHWWRIVERYPDVTDAHRMSLFKTTFQNHIHNLAKHKTRCPEVTVTVLAGNEDHSDFWERLVVEDFDFANCNLLIAKAPEPVQKFMRLMASEDGPRHMRALYRKRRGGGRETTNDRLCRLLGIEHADILGMVRDYLKGSLAGSATAAV